MKNIVLTGMPGSGKSTTGVILAKTLCVDFCDTDLVIQNRQKKPLAGIIADEGTEGFLDIECEALSSLGLTETVIATGGSAVCRDAAMKKLKAGGAVVYLEVDFEEISRRVGNITTRGIAVSPGQSLADVYEFRRPLYEKYADITIKCGALTIEETVAAIIRAMI